MQYCFFQLNNFLCCNVGLQEVNSSTIVSILLISPFLKASSNFNLSKDALSWGESLMILAVYSKVVSVLSVIYYGF